MHTSTRTLATATACALGVFPTVVVLLNLVQAPHYSARSQAMSELALGRGGGLMFLAFTMMGAGTFLLALLLHRELPRAKVAPAALTLAAALDLLSAVFHTNLQNTPATTSSNIHMVAGISTFILVVIAMFTTIRHMRHHPRWAGYATPTTVWSLLAFGTFFLIPLLGNSSFGLAQRTFVATWLSWMISTALITRRTAQVAPRSEPAPQDA